MASTRTPSRKPLTRGSLEIRTSSVYEMDDAGCYDLVVLDNVLEHLPDEPREALELLSRSLRPGGAIYILVPSKLWPIEVHYYLPFLSYLPLRLANWYLRLTGPGSDYTDASYAPTYFGLKRLLRKGTGNFLSIRPARRAVVNDRWPVPALPPGGRRTAAIPSALGHLQGIPGGSDQDGKYRGVNGSPPFPARNWKPLRRGQLGGTQY